MAKGLLTIEGTLDLAQFWPRGESDADTTKLLITVSPDAIRFQPKKSAPAQPTQAFDGAWLKASGPTKTVIDKKGRITVRLQGIDAPELHYGPAPLGRKASVTDEMRAALKAVNHKYRQHHGQSAAKALLDMLSAAGPGPLPCAFVTAVDHPNDVCDKYGRMVGDVVAEVNGKKININRWVLAQGWAVPAYYNSMSKSEITALQKLTAKAQGKGSGIWGDYRAKFGTFNFKLLHIAGKNLPDFQMGDDAGPVILPKIYRRQTTWACYRKAGILDQSFAQYLKSLKERFYGTADYLANADAAAWLQISSFVKSGQFNLGPGDMVFEEAESTLISAAGEPVTAW